MKYILIGVLVLASAASCGRKVRTVTGEKGADGAQGEAGLPGADAIVEVIDPCGDTSNVVDEIFLRLNTGDLLVFFADNSNSKNGRLASIGEGHYMTTDGTNCHVYVDSELNVTW